MREILGMPPEPIEILAGAGGVVWSAAWLRFVLDPLVMAGPAYRELARLPPGAQALIVLVAAQGGIFQIACACANVAPLRCAVALAMSLFWSLVLLHVWMQVGFSPTAACYVLLVMLNWTAAVMLAMSGYVRFWR